MTIALFGNTLTDAWLEGTAQLHEGDGEVLNLVMTIADPDPNHADPTVVDALNRLLCQRGKQTVETVANTIFPSAFLRGRCSRDEFYQRYLASLPRLLKQKGNGHGTYFGRLIQYPASADIKHGQTTNQIEGIIKKLETQLRTRNPKRFAYTAQVFAPGRDDNTTMGFPCLSHLSFQLVNSRLCLTAVYRNHYYFQRALGNFIGLARLQQFIANAVGLGLGPLTVHACHAEIDVLGRRETEKLLRACREIAPYAAVA
jgi:hypothetical protein